MICGIAHRTIERCQEHLTFSSRCLNEVYEIDMYFYAAQLKKKDALRKVGHSAK